MKFFQNLVPLVASAVSLFSLDVQARSQAPRAIRHVTNINHAVINTPSHQIDHLSHFDLTFTLHRGTQRVKLELEPNHDILADDAYVQYIDVDGNIKQEEAIKRHEHKVYKGDAFVGRDNNRWNPVGFARIYMKQDGPQPLFEGVFSVNGDHHHIELQSTYLETKREDDVDIKRSKDDYMVVYRDSDMVRYVHSELKRSLDTSSSCEADKLGFNTDPLHPIHQSNSKRDTSQWGSMSLNSMFGMSKRQSDISGSSGNSGGVNLKSTIGDTSGCPDTKKVALIGIATDCTLTNSFKSNQTAREWIINTVNSASNVYEKSFNISIGLRNLTVSDGNCPDSASTAAPWNIACDSGNITSRLDSFSKWRGSQSDNNAYWTLMSGCPTGAEVGLSWLGQLCNSEVASQGSESVSGTNVVVRTSGAGWQVFAHESGHTFGAVHDCDQDTCNQGLDASSQCCPYSSSKCDADSQYIMNPSTRDDISKFSACTIGNICSGLGRNNVKSSCLSDNKGVTTITGSQCGNGIVEDGEDCDCGGEDSCGSNSCCDAKTCKFKDGAVCDDANDSCCSKCQYSSADTVCRASRGECDLEEKCSGDSSSCPSDKYKDDGTSCGDSSGLTCASGQCTSRDYQCRTLMGSLLNTNDTYACDSSSCTLTCASSNMQSNACAALNQNFLDGTPCGGGGKCDNGQCKGSSVGGEIRSWIDDHKNVVIAVACAVGGLILIMLTSCLINRCRRRPAVKPPPPVRYANGWVGPMPPPQRGPMGQWNGAPNGGYRGLGTEPPPPYPGPARYA
ncbi:hypothetical protein ASPWEDRAFT_102687 [Aspergillus wentii DTO 134E9]|uniref:Disintegrin and metalloproteinase domain-containing protein B n=1 Tax=Aspergillus wentii DTO 134E9 TaxID=1073089 RepID=A0A1L9S0C6_ASPWE|nr:uncharacterized protein ASPWEDRAFT_102687 [Aspergillus wentii DTO 134E9]KAI9931365.1 hypothetical protein MW887_011029 [Aspergillus wentii]OJJ40621.1 hypothetical protein ASPWEDRAFT_102687 [Aspergillus wentii DTO 134E9]